MQLNTLYNVALILLGTWSYNDSQCYSPGHATRTECTTTDRYRRETRWVALTAMFSLLMSNTWFWISH